MNKEGIIEYLSYDKMFGILTRPALELKIEGTINACLIDFNNLKKLNQLLGYNKVNARIFKIFEKFKCYGCVCGRWFSGDEILIVDKDIEPKISQLEKISHKYGMTFKTIFFQDRSLKQIEKIIGDYKDAQTKG